MLAPNFLQWARACFAEEIRTDFLRARSFDGLISKQKLSVLREQPPDHLRVLARILPLGIWSTSPVAEAGRNQLSAEEKEVLEVLGTRCNGRYANEFPPLVERIQRQNTKQIRQEFRAARRRGSQIIKEIALKWNYQMACAAAGEWGLICERSWGRASVSLHLQRYMALTYCVSISDTSNHAIRFHDHYLGVLGIGASEWTIDSADQIEEKLRTASELAWWHVCEYERIMAAVPRAYEHAP